MANGNGDTAPKRSGGKGVGFHKGSLGSPFQLETYGARGVEPGSADEEDGIRIGPGVLKGRVTAEYSRNSNGNGGRNGGNGR